MTLQKQKVRKIQKIRDSARGEECTMRGPKCNYDPETTVWCHSNYSYHGKGVGLKSYDIFGFYACSGCHQWFDFELRNKSDVQMLHYQQAHDSSLLRLLEKGVLK